MKTTSEKCAASASVSRFILAFATVIIVCVMTCSCGYHMGSMMHPQVKTIAIADIRNDTKEPMLTAIVRKHLAEQIMTDGSLELENKETADCILYCRIAKVTSGTSRQDTTYGSKSYRPSEFVVKIEAEFQVIIPGRSEPLIPLRDVSASSRFQYEADSQVGRLGGLNQASFDLARLIVQYTTEAW